MDRCQPLLTSPFLAYLSLPANIVPDLAKNEGILGYRCFNVIFISLLQNQHLFSISGLGKVAQIRGMMEMAMKLCRSTQITFTRDLTVSLHEFKRYTGSKVWLES
ncbi:MAG: hypothetical protein LBV40_05960 [Methanomicrobiales archaeon]|nr:hypothetical protein [Methanomicrobiales archaeon]